MRLLLAEDEKELSNALAAVFKHNKYSVDTVYNGQDAYDWAKNGNYDGIILDIMMPKMSGLEVLKKLRHEGVTIPILLLTAKSEIEDRINGLDLGADDYLPKPFDTGELMARVRAMLRRNSEFEPSIKSFGDITLDKKSFTLMCGEKSVTLGNKEFQMLEMLMNNPKNVISADMFMEKIWGYESETEQNVVWVYISYLRKKLKQIDANVEIKAIRGIGYTLTENIKVGK